MLCFLPDAEEAGADQKEGRSCGEHSGHFRTRKGGTAAKVIWQRIVNKDTGLNWESSREQTF